MIGVWQADMGGLSDKTNSARIVAEPAHNCRLDGSTVRRLDDSAAGWRYHLTAQYIGTDEDLSSMSSTCIVLLRTARPRSSVTEVSSPKASDSEAEQ